MLDLLLFDRWTTRYIHLSFILHTFVYSTLLISERFVTCSLKVKIQCELMIKLTRDNFRARDKLQMNPHRHNSITMNMSMKCDTVISHKGHKRKDTTMTHMPIDWLDKSGRQKSIQRNQNDTDQGKVEDCRCCLGLVSVWSIVGWTRRATRHSIIPQLFWWPEMLMVW